MQAILNGKDVKLRLEQFPRSSVTSVSMPTWIYFLTRLYLLKQDKPKNFSQFVRELLEQTLSSKEVEVCEFSREQVEEVLLRCRKELKADVIRDYLGLRAGITPLVNSKGRPNGKVQNPADVLKKLRDFHKAGLITDADFSRQKEEVLKSLRT